MKVSALRPPAENASVVVEIVTLIAAVEGRNPEEIDPPLYDAVETTALENLFALDGPGNVEGRVTFEYRGYDVTVASDRRVSIEFPVADAARDADAPSGTRRSRE